MSIKISMTRDYVVMVNGAPSTSVAVLPDTTDDDRVRIQHHWGLASQHPILVSPKTALELAEAIKMAISEWEASSDHTKS